MHLTDSQLTAARPRWLGDLFLIESLYGKLVYLAGLLDPNTGRYEHYGSGVTGSHVDANRVLGRWHASLFKEWSGYSLERKMADVRFYIAGLGPLDRVQFVDAWLRLRPYKNLVPAAIQGPERQKHVSDFEAILGLLRNQFGIASPGLTA
jgi:hypothetical protein